MQIKVWSHSYCTHPPLQKHLPQRKPGLLRQLIAQVVKLKPPAYLYHWHIFCTNWANVAVLQGEALARCPSREEKVKYYIAQNYGKNKKLDSLVLCMCWKSFEEQPGGFLCWGTAEVESLKCYLWNFSMSLTPALLALPAIWVKLQVGTPSLLSSGLCLPQISTHGIMHASLERYTRHMAHLTDSEESHHHLWGQKQAEGLQISVSICWYALQTT